jgi:hypothetical protein
VCLQSTESSHGTASPVTARRKSAGRGLTVGAPNLRGEQEEGESKEFYTEGNEGREGEEDCKAVRA